MRSVSGFPHNSLRVRVRRSLRVRVRVSVRIGYQVDDKVFKNFIQSPKLCLYWSLRNESLGCGLGLTEVRLSEFM